MSKETYPASPLEPLPCKCLFYYSPDEISVRGDICLKFLQGGFCLPSRVGFFFFLALWTGVFFGRSQHRLHPLHIIPRPLGHKPLSNPFLQQRGSRGRRDLFAKTLSNQLGIYFSPPSSGKFWKTTTNTRWQSKMKVWLCVVDRVPTT